MHVGIISHWLRCITLNNANARVYKSGSRLCLHISVVVHTQINGAETTDSFIHLSPGLKRKVRKRGQQEERKVALGEFSPPQNDVRV